MNASTPVPATTTPAPLWRRVSLQWLVAAAVTWSTAAMAQVPATDAIANAIAKNGLAVVIVEFHLPSSKADSSINGAAEQALDDRRAEIAATRALLAQDFTALGLKIEDEFDNLPIIVTQVHSAEVLNKLVQLPLVKAVTLNSRERPARPG